MKLEIKVGSIEVRYELFLTDAPSDYDYGGVFTVINYGAPLPRDSGFRTHGPARIVAVPVATVLAQTGRYRSGLHCAWPADDCRQALHLNQRDLEETLYRRFLSPAA